MVGEAPLKRMEGGKRKGKRANKMEEVAPGMAVLSLKYLRGKLTPFQNCHPRAGKGKRTHKTSSNKQILFVAHD